MTQSNGFCFAGGWKANAPINVMPAGEEAGHRVGI